MGASGCGVLLSILMPVYNEQTTVVQIIDRVMTVQWPEGLDIELVVIDDGSTDGSRQCLEQLEQGGKYPELRVLYQVVNQGKGAAIISGFAAARGDITAIQDADLEYDPNDLPKLVEPVTAGRADVVYGSRFFGERPTSLMPHLLANKLLTCLSNLFTGLHLTDMETCYKVISRKCLLNLNLRSKRFGIEPELTAKLARSGWRFAEKPISYAYRDYQAGKKIGWRDGVKAIISIVYFTWFD